MSSLYRRLQQRSEEFYQCTDDPSDAASLRRQEITVGTLCGLHVAHNSMKWATCQHLDDVRSDLKTIFVIVDSLRNSIHDLVVHFGSLLHSVEWVESEEPERWVIQLWQLLGLSASDSEWLASVHIRFFEGRLHVGSKLRDDPSFVDKCPPPS